MSVFPFLRLKNKGISLIESLLAVVLLSVVATLVGFCLVKISQGIVHLKQISMAQDLARSVLTAAQMNASTVPLPSARIKLPQ